MTSNEQAPSNDSKNADPGLDGEILEAYREVAELCRWIPGEGQEAVDARLELFNAFGRLAELEESVGQNSKGLAARESATSIIRQAQQLTGDNVAIRMMEASQMNGRGFTLREMENWTDALDIYTELAELMDDGADGSAGALYLMAAAQDGIGDVQDTLGNPAARDDAWERARILFQSCIHAVERDPEAVFPFVAPRVPLDDVIAKQQEFL
jgi:tetratricopeptide (TPR) repeat protein